MSNKLKLSENIVLDLEKRKVKKIKIFFYKSWCSGTKVDILEEDFDEKSLVQLKTEYDFWVYVEEKDEEKFENTIITKTIKKDHTGNEKIRYIFTSNNIQERCGCWSSFSFEKLKPKINIQKLKELKNKF